LAEAEIGGLARFLERVEHLESERGREVERS
jgi:hypothetical protein